MKRLSGKIREKRMTISVIEISRMKSVSFWESEQKGWPGRDGMSAR